MTPKHADAVHSEPVWRDRADFVIGVRLSFNLVDKAKIDGGIERLASLVKS